MYTFGCRDPNSSSSQSRGYLCSRMRNLKALIKHVFFLNFRNKFIKGVAFNPDFNCHFEGREGAGGGRPVGSVVPWIVEG